MYCNLILMHVFLVSIYRFTTNYTLSNIGVHLRSETELGTSTLVQMWGSFKNDERLDPIINPLFYVLNEYLPSRLKIFKCNFFFFNHGLFWKPWHALGEPCSKCVKGNCNLHVLVHQIIGVCSKQHNLHKQYLTQFNPSLLILLKLFPSKSQENQIRRNERSCEWHQQPQEVLVKWWSAN